MEGCGSFGASEHNPDFREIKFLLNRLSFKIIPITSVVIKYPVPTLKVIVK